MSFDPSVVTALPQPGAPAATPSGVAAPKRRRSGIVIAVIGLLAGLAGAAASYVLQQAAFSSSVKDLQRAANGLQTNFVFEKEGTFTLYYEYAGTFDAEVDDTDETFELDAPDAPRRVTLTLSDESGDALRLHRDVPDVSYDVAGFKGVAYRQVEIEDPGDYRLEVTGRSRDAFAVAIGYGTLNTPNLLLPVAILAAGLVVALVGLLTSKRRTVPPVVPVASSPGTSTGPWMPGPPSAGLPGGWGAPGAPVGPPGTPYAGPPAAATPPPVPTPPQVSPPTPPAPEPSPPANSWPPPPSA